MSQGAVTASRIGVVWQDLVMRTIRHSRHRRSAADSRLWRGGDRTPPERTMGDVELGRWLHARRARGPLATTLPMLDGFVTAMAAGPLGRDLLGQICGALAVGRSALDVGGTLEFAAFRATADRFNAISQRLEDADPDPFHQRKPNGSVDATEWCEGFVAAVDLDRAAWKEVLDLASPLHGLMLPILVHCKTKLGAPMLGRPRPGIQTQTRLRQAYADIPTCVRAIRNHYHVTHYDKPRSGASRC